MNSNSSVLSASGPGGASYTVRTVEGAGTARARTTLSGLQKHTAYAVVVQAYNSRGAGPASPPTTATTMEDGEDGQIKVNICLKELRIKLRIGNL